MRRFHRPSLAPLTGGTGDGVLLAAALAAFAAQRMALTHLGQDGFAGDARRSVYFLTTAIVLALCFGFRRYLGAWAIAVGIAMNFAPMALHGGLMPVAYETVSESGAFPAITEASIGHQLPNSKDIVLERKDIDLELLTDRFVLTAPAYGTNVYSLGDFVIFGGVLLTAGQVVGGLVVPRRPREGAPADA